MEKESEELIASKNRNRDAEEIAQPMKKRRRMNQKDKFVNRITNYLTGSNDIRMKVGDETRTDAKKVEKDVDEPGAGDGDPERLELVMTITTM